MSGSSPLPKEQGAACFGGTMKAERYLQMLQKDIHSVVRASTDENGLPVTCVIDVMLAGQDGLSFLTAKGKALYRRLKERPFVSITGFTGKSTMKSRAVTLRGETRETGRDELAEIFRENPYMVEIYPSTESRTVLTVFRLYRGSGEFFDLSQKPVFREAFSFGGLKTHAEAFFITADCNGCGRCAAACPQDCIDLSVRPACIRQEHCLHCGKCEELCPRQAVERRAL